MAASNKATTGPSNLPNYFNKLSQMYPRQTGNSTLNLFIKTTDHLAPISTNSIIHDNACGPGTASSVILKITNPDEHPKIIATDMVPGMIDAFNTAIVGTSSKPELLTGIVMNSQKLEFPDAHFTHSITNFSIFNFAEPLTCVKEIYRTLKPSGQAVITTWRRFGIGEVVHETQRRIRPDLPLMKYSGSELFDGDVVKDLMIEAGFENAEVLSTMVVVDGDDLEGLTEFASGSFTDSARKGWSDDEKDRWKEVLQEVLNDEKREFKGIKFEAWAVLGFK
jgi:ubiquinone/menaquinone biosynthesis C-methylase UbiE